MTVNVKTRPHQPLTNSPYSLKVGSSNNIRQNLSNYLQDSPIKPPYTDVIDPKTGEPIYGFRYVTEIDTDGKTKLIQVPLTYEEYLHPEEGDALMSNSEHDKVLSYVRGVFSADVLHMPPPTVYREVRMDFDLPNTSPYLPDIAVIYGVNDPERPRSTFSVREEGTMPSLVVEATSPSTRHADFDGKLQGYAQAGVPYYVIIDTLYDDITGDIDYRQIIGYELTPNGYIEMQPNHQGWLWLDPVEMWIGLDGPHVQCYDAQGNYLRDQRELRQGLANTETQLANTETQLANTETQLAESEAKAAQLADYLRSLGIDPDNLPT
ncbi:MAG: Uma2 family endonuclease [Chloroflexota bacterium]